MQRRLLLTAVRWALRLAAMYSIIVLGVMALEERLIFPKRDVNFEPPPGLKSEDVYLTAADGVRIHGLWIPCPQNVREASPWQGSQLTILYCHGNGGDVSMWQRPAVAWQKQLGADYFVFDFHGYGNSDGVPSENNLRLDAQAAYDWLVNEKKIDPATILIVGRSLGGAIAIDLATRVKKRALIATDTFTTMADVSQRLFPWLPVQWVLRNRFASIDRIGNVSGPVFIAHGDKDTLVPIALGEKLFEAANTPKEYFVMRGKPHDSGPGEDFYIALRAFLERNQ